MTVKASNDTKPPFDPEGGRIIHKRLGIWELYEKVEDHKPWFSWPSFQIIDELLTSMPFVLRAFRTVAVLGYKTLIVYLLAMFISSLLPAITLYYSGQLLQVVQTSIDSRSVDQAILISVLAAKCACGIAEYLSNLTQHWAGSRLSITMRSHFTEHTFQAHARLDVPTYDDPSVRGQLTSVTSSVAWDAISHSTHIVSTLLQLISQFTVLVSVVRAQPDGVLLACLSFVEPVLSLFNGRNAYFTNRGKRYIL
jgi:ABC-type multidrug transport system fused ATPase/permease subunit